MTRQAKQYAWQERQKKTKLLVLVEEQLFLTPTPASIHSLSPTQPYCFSLIAPIELLVTMITKEIEAYDLHTELYYSQFTEGGN